MAARLTLRHVEPPWQGDCVQGVLDSIALGFAAQDINAQVLADGLFAAAHSSRIGKGFLDSPWTGLPVGTPLHKVTSAQWVALGPPKPGAPQRPALASDIIAAVAGKPFTPCYEVKPGTGTHKTKPYLDLKAAAVTHQVPIIVMTVQSYGSTAKAKAAWEASAKLRMVAAGKVGLPRMLLWREHIPDDSDWWDLLEAVKGAPASQALPAHVVRVPNTSAPTTARQVLAKVTAKADWKPTTPEVPPVTPTVEPLRVDAVDLSHHNGVTLDALAKAKAAGVKAVWHKVTEGNTFVDVTYAWRRSLAKDSGLPFGAYHFARPGSGTGKAQAGTFLSNATPKPGDLLPMLDLEDNGGGDTVALSAWVAEFVAEVKAQLGVVPIIYTPFALASTFGCPLWVARYHNQNAAPNIPQPWTEYAIRQFSNGVYGVPNTVPGLGAVDLDQIEVPVESLLIPTPAPPPTPEVPVTDDRYDRVTFRGRTVDKWTQQALEAVEKDLGYELTLTQGSYNAGKVSASAGTHDGGGVVDLAPYDWQRKVRSLREHGFAAWHRTPIPNVWPEHIHAVQAGNEKAAPSAQRQVAAYKAGRNGLANNGPDDGPRIPLVPFKYEEDDMPYTKDEIQALVAAEIAKPRVSVPADWSTTDKDGAKKSIADAIEMLMRELVRQRPPKGTV